MKPEFLEFRNMKHLLHLLFLSALTSSFAQTPNNSIVIGKVDSIYSNILKEECKIWVYVPDGLSPFYAKKHYPVVYLFDGDGHFHSVTGMIQQLSQVNNNTVLPEMIVVGITNTDRTRDLTPTHVSSSPYMDSLMLKSSGGGENFTAFIEKELIPHIDSVYPTAPYRVLIGHSLGGFLSLMCAARHPVLGGLPVRGVLLMDSPVIGGWRATALSVAKRARLVGSVGPGTISRKRKHQWASQDEVMAHFRSKKAFAQWDDQVLRDYIEHGTHDVEREDKANDAAAVQRHLSFDRDVETAIYNTLPDIMDALLKRKPLKCPAAFIGGLQSVEIKQVGMALTHKVTQGRITMMGGSHLFPMEKPAAAAAAVEAALLNMTG